VCVFWSACSPSLQQSLHLVLPAQADPDLPPSPQICPVLALESCTRSALALLPLLRCHSPIPDSRPSLHRPGQPILWVLHFLSFPHSTSPSSHHLPARRSTTATGTERSSQFGRDRGIGREPDSAVESRDKGTPLFDPPTQPRSPSPLVPAPSAPRTRHDETRRLGHVLTPTPLAHRPLRLSTHYLLLLILSSPVETPARLRRTGRSAHRPPRPPPSLRQAHNRLRFPPIVSRSRLCVAAPTRTALSPSQSGRQKKQY
jgi:hypothetical protein